MFDPNSPIYNVLSNLLMGDVIVLSPPILQSLTTSKLTDFSVYFKRIHEKHI